MRCVPGTTTVVVVSVAVMKSASVAAGPAQLAAIATAQCVPRPRRPLVAARSRRSLTRIAHWNADSPMILILCTGNATRSVIAGAVLAGPPPRRRGRHGRHDVDRRAADELADAGRLRGRRRHAAGAPQPPGRGRRPRPGDGRHRPRPRARRVGPPRAPVGGAAHGDAEAPRPRPRRRRPAARRARRRARPRRASSWPPWEEVVDPGGGEVEAFIACAQEVVALVDDVADRLRPAPAGDRRWTGERADALGRRWPTTSTRQLAPVVRRAVRRRRAAARRAGARRRLRHRADDAAGRRARRPDRPRRRRRRRAGDARRRGAEPRAGRRADRVGEADVGDVGSRRPAASTPCISRFGRDVLRRPASGVRQPRPRRRAGRAAVRRRVGATAASRRSSSCRSTVALAELAPGDRRRSCRRPTTVRSRSATPMPSSTLLERAGWRDVGVDAHAPCASPSAAAVGPDAAAAMSMDLGPTRIVTE